ncbi:AP-3 complex subunit sigma-2 [Amazona aestiva]|uniref:AP-3 complex subunit sigma-2 n=1 Tax=Amazona aestiva TaxID=12930 RepID=A0A0Q3MQK2_AMAAE|nr:AP-3 complex subunit sigma-2 [Amazona aestiva]
MVSHLSQSEGGDRIPTQLSQSEGGDTILTSSANQKVGIRSSDNSANQKVFVETLDKCFENVCELDLIFHMDKVHHILQEMVIGGMVLETNMNEIVAQVEAQSKLEKAEGGLSAAPSRAVSAVKNINLPEIPRNINIGDINIKVPNLSQFM